MIEFALRLLLPVSTKGTKQPDIVMGCTVHLLAAWSAQKLAYRYGVPFVFEIRDVWPETLIDLGKLRAKSLSAKLMSMLSKYLCRKAELVISPLPGVRDYLDEMGLGEKPFCWVSNGLEDAPASFVPRDQTRDEFTFMYLGSHGHANGLHGLLDSFDRAVQEVGGSIKLRLRLVGDGPLKTNLQEYARSLSCNDMIEFHDRVSRKVALEIAQEADAFVVNIENLPVYRFGISLNKLFDYMVAGRPTVIATSASNNPIAEARGGITVSAGEPTLLASALCEMATCSTAERATMGANAFEYVLAHYTADTLAGHLSDGLARILEGTDTSSSPDSGTRKSPDIP